MRYQLPQPAITACEVIIKKIIIIKNEKIKVTLCENAAGALYIVSKMCIDGQRKVLGETSGRGMSSVHWKGTVAEH